MHIFYIIYTKIFRLIFFFDSLPGKFKNTYLQIEFQLKKYIFIYVYCILFLKKAFY